MILQSLTSGQEDFIDLNEIKKQQKEEVAKHTNVLKKILASKYIKINIFNEKKNSLLSISSNKYFSEILGELEIASIYHVEDESEAEDLFFLSVYTREHITDEWNLHNDIKITIPYASWFESVEKLNNGIIFRCYFINNKDSYIDYAIKNPKVIANILSLYKKLLLLHYGDNQMNNTKYLNGIKPYVE